MCNQLLKMNPAQQEVWNPCDNLFAKCKNNNYYAIIILNTCFKFHPNFLLNLWNQAKVRITVDGGTEKWLEWLKLNDLDNDKISPPDLITGDMDSIRRETIDYFLSNDRSKVVRTPDQNETDFTKSLKELDKFCAVQNIELDTVYVIADTCGRLDQIMANINTLSKAPGIVKNIKVFQVASNSLTWLLPEGKHTINVPLILRQTSEWCALIPLKPALVTSSGLKWNLENTKMEFGGMVSTSNTYDDVSSKVIVQTNGTIVWSMGISPLLEAD